MSRILYCAGRALLFLLFSLRHFEQQLFTTLKHFSEFTITGYGMKAARSGSGLDEIWTFLMICMRI